MVGWQSAQLDVHLGHNGFFAAPAAGASSCGYNAGGRKALAGLTLASLVLSTLRTLIARFPADAEIAALQIPANGTALVSLNLGSHKLTVSRGP